MLSQALMLAAAADSGPGCEALLGGAATLELADALGRTALMFAAGNVACAALASLLDAGASVSNVVVRHPAHRKVGSTCNFRALRLMHASFRCAC